MQLNGTEGVIMAASEAPEPPPRNPDKINASLKQTSETKSSKSLDVCDRPTTNNNLNNGKTLHTIMSLDSSVSAKNPPTTATPASTTGTTKSNDVTTIPSPTTATTTVDATTTLTSESTPATDPKCNSPKADETNGKIVGKSSSISATSASKIDADECNAAAKCGGSNDLISSNRNDNDTATASDAPNKHHECNDTEHNAVSVAESNLEQENLRMQNEIARLKKLLANSPDGAVGGVELSDGAETSDDRPTSKDANRLEIELRAAREQISNLKIERRKLKAEKIDLLAHVKQLCASLQDKEQELRDFIRNFEHRIRETESSNAKMSTERERERWSLLKHAREEAERSIALATQLNTRDMQLKRAQEQLQEARRQLSGCMSDQESLLSYAPLTPPSGMMNHLAGGSHSGGYLAPGTSGMIGLTAGDRGSCSADSGVRGSSDRESAAGDLNLSDGACDNGPCITIDSDSISLVSSQYMNQYGTPKERSPTLSPLNAGAFARSIDGTSSGVLSRSVEQIGSPIDSEAGAAQMHYQQPMVQRRVIKSGTSTLGSRGHRSSGGGGTWGSISRVFARSRHRNKNNSLQSEMDDPTAHYHNQWSPLTEETYAEKLRLLREASALPMDRWRASQVLAWLEVALGMPQYSQRCSENVKSGKVLLELNDSELESGLGLTHPMHRKKIRLAIEEHRRPEMMRYLTIGQLGHTWVATEWLPDIGLPQYAESFLHSFVDARMLDTLSKKELEKFLGVTRKFHQASIVHGIHVLRIMKYDRQALAMRRLQCENLDSDPIVWTNQKFIRWARAIDLGEYAENLKDSGVHGGLVVLEPSFSGETMATAMGIPSSKNIIRRHLCTEFDALVLPARATLGQGIRTGAGSVVPITGPGGLQSTNHTTSTTDRRSSGSLRGSLQNVFRFNTSTSSKSNRGDGNKAMGTSTSPTPSYSSQSSEYATVGSIIPPPLPSTGPPATLPHHSRSYHVGSDGLASPMQPQPPNHRVSAPPMDTNTGTMPQYAEHRRVKSINDIEIVSATPV